MTEFADQLRNLGFDVSEPKPGFLAFPYEIELGSRQGETVMLAFQAPSFPASPPPGPHVSPRLMPQNTSSQTHPEGGIHASDLGDEWQYWSRPFNRWEQTKRTAGDYLAFVRSLFEAI